MTNPQNNDYVSPSDEELEAMMKKMLCEIFDLDPDSPTWDVDKQTAKDTFPDEAN